MAPASHGALRAPTLPLTKPAVSSCPGVTGMLEGVRDEDDEAHAMLKHAVRIDEQI